MKSRDYIVYGIIIIAFVALFLVAPIVFRVYEFEILPAQFFGALVGVFITAIVTAFLLRGQTAGDEKREKSIKVFEKKQEIYHDFLAKLKEIIQDGEIHIGTKNKDGSINHSVDDLKDLIFQLAYLQLHTSENAINEILDKISILIQKLNDFNSTQEADKQQKMAEFYSSLSNEIFEIVAILKKDLYNKDCSPITKDKMIAILRECGLFVETDLNRYEMQNYFWEELQKQLMQKGYKFEQRDFKQDVNEYYARARNRRRYYGIDFSFTVNGKKIDFKIELDNHYIYGFRNLDRNKKYPELEQIIQKVSSKFKCRDWWYGEKSSDRYDLDFWKLNSKEFERLNNTRQREQLIADIAKEIDDYIKKFIKIAEQNNF
jgi:hypothetical protein